MRNNPFPPQFDDWDDEWAATLRRKSGFFGRSVQSQLEGLSKGDTLEVLSYPVLQELRAGTLRQITKAWLKVLAKEATADPTANAIWSATGGLLAITTTNNPGVGQILNASAPECRFDLTRANTVNLGGNQTYFFAVQVLADDGAIYEIETGFFHVKPNLITATS